MNPPESPTPPLKTLTPELSASLRECAKSTLAKIFRSNCETQYFRHSEPLAGFRNVVFSINWDPAATDGDQDPLFETFREAVPFSSYPDYLPFISRFLESPCNISDIKDLLSPGLPEFIAHSSGTSGGAFKYFPKYKHDQGRPVPERGAKPPSITICLITNLRSFGSLDIVDGENGGSNVKTIPIGGISAKLISRAFGIDINDDATLMGRHVPSSNTSPHAVSFIPSYPLCFLMHGLFAIADPSLVFIGITFSPWFYDFIRLLDENWDALVQAIEDGQLPELGDLGNAKPYLQASMKADASRAAELRCIDRKQEGWLKKVWPHLAILNAISSGPYSAIIPKIRFHIGPSVSIHSTTYAATECQIGYAYDARDHNLFKVGNGEYFEFLPMGRPESVDELCQIWELTSGQKYEIVVTTQDGLWRYRLGDIVEVSGFDPVDGQPLVSYSERRRMGLRVVGEFVTEKELQDAVNALEGTLGCILEFTMAVDERKTLRAYGVFVELEGAPGPNARAALETLQSTLSDGNEAYKHFVVEKFIGAPTIRVLAPGTFREYREWKVDLNGCGSGQVKVPAVLFDVETVEWFSKRVVHEIEMQ